ncbi:MAG: hypothetical protein QM638_10345 [Nocardioides sp.]|uniref:hypothetical protein n=1 Tax=Nocardioides sp. TaxID=35761 RepID=UPI0039E34B0D
MLITPEDPILLHVDLRRDLLAQGYTDKSLAAGRRSGLFAQPRRGAYVPGDVWRSLSDDQRYAVRCRTALMQARADSVLSHASALPFLAAPLWGQDLTAVHLTRADGRTGRHERGIRQHSGVIADGDLMEENGLRFVGATRAALEVAGVCSVEAALVVLNDLLHRGLTTTEDLWKRYRAGMGRWPNSLATNVVLRLVNPLVESVGESRTDYLMWKQGLPRGIPQYEVRDSDGTLVGKLDFALPEYGIWIEFDGLVKYERYLRPGESATDVVVREKRREDRIREITGWLCLRVVWADLANPLRLAARIRAMIEAAAVARRGGRVRA